METQAENLKYNTGWRRLGAAVADALLIGTGFIVVYWLVTTYNHSGGSAIENYYWTLLASAASIGYSVWMHWKYGQTVGKMIAGIKVVDKSETKSITLLQAVLRDGFYILAATVFLIIIGFSLKQENAIVFEDTAYLLQAQETTYYWQQLNDYAGTVWVIIELLTMLFNDKRRALHDYMAATVVIRIDIIPNPAKNSYTPQTQ
ncbi:MAG: RDD family protein [Ferruginibacter sp.]